MNILLLTFAYLPSTGGVQRLVHDLASSLVARGHKVTIVTDGPWSGRETLGMQREAPADVLVLRIPTCFHWSKRHEVRSRVRDAWNLLQLVWLCRQRKIEVVHGHLINVDTRYGVLLKRLLGVKLVVTLHGNETSSWSKDQPHRVAYVRKMLRAADAVTALSERQMAEAREMEPAIAGEREVISNPVSLEAIDRALDANMILPARPYFVYVGRFVSCKSLETVIEAYHRVAAANRDFPVDLALVGGGELETALRQQAAQGAGAERIHFLGERTWGQSLRMIQGATALILASHEDEGCPMVLLEAMALGTPIVVSDNPRMAEMVTAGANGEAFPCRDAEALRRALEHAAGAADRREAYAREGRLYLEQKHQPERILAAYEALYARLGATADSR